MSGQTGATACVLIIGNEILSGKTQDANLRFLGVELAKLGRESAAARLGAMQGYPGLMVQAHQSFGPGGTD